MMITWTVEELRQRAEKKREKLEDICGATLDDFIVDDILYYLSEASVPMTLWLAEHRLYFDGSLHFDPSEFDVISERAQAIIDEYEGAPGTLWEDFGLSGDDDVDYNGGYILIFLETIRELNNGTVDTNS